MHARAALIDAVLREAWRLHCAAQATWALAAVGGYGRGELHPASDIDILLLVPQSPDAGSGPAVERLVTFLWDIGLEVGHSVRTIAECREECVGDVSVMTTLLEARLLAGSAPLYVGHIPLPIYDHIRGEFVRAKHVDQIGVTGENDRNRSRAALEVALHFSL